MEKIKFLKKNLEKLRVWSSVSVHGPGLVESQSAVQIRCLGGLLEMWPCMDFLDLQQLDCVASGWHKLSFGNSTIIQSFIKPIFKPWLSTDLDSDNLAIFVTRMSVDGITSRK